jgi:hypothetical protein
MIDAQVFIYLYKNAFNMKLNAYVIFPSLNIFHFLYFLELLFSLYQFYSLSFDPTVARTHDLPHSIRKR